MSYKVISIQQEREWVYYVKNAMVYDFYHTWHYHTLEKRGEPLLFVYEDEDVYIAFPLVKRKIENSNYFDLTATYGYVGPISNKDYNDLSSRFLDNFKSSFTNFMSVNGFVSVFSRLNPFIRQHQILGKIAESVDNGKTIYMDLTVPVEEQRACYDKRLGRQIRQLRKANYIVKETNSLNDIKTFTCMYNENMQRLHADPSYFHGEDYFIAILKNSESGSKLITIFEGDLMICGAIILYSCNVIRNHLSATKASHISQSPSKLLTDEISILGRKLGLKYFHLGGGLGGKEDSLFKFKCSFSPLTLKDNIWCFIANKNAYNQLTKGSNKNSTYFPLYRSPKRPL